MKNFSVLIVFLLCLLSCNNELKRIELYNSKGNISEVYYLDKNNKKQGLDILYYDNGNIDAIVEFRNNIPFGNVTSYFSNKKLKKKFKLFDKIHRDTFYKFYENGKIRFKAIYGVGNKESIVKKISYYTNGKIKREISYIEGNNIGLYNSHRIKYFPDGQIDYLNSNFLKIKYLNTNATKIRFTIFRSEYINSSEYNLDNNRTLYLVNNFDEQFSLNNKFVRIIKLPINKSFEITFLPTDYINGKLNIIIVDNHNKTMYYVQLIKGDKSRWHNVHGIVKEGNESLLH